MHGLFLRLPYTLATKRYMIYRVVLPLHSMHLVKETFKKTVHIYQDFPERNRIVYDNISMFLFYIRKLNFRELGFFLSEYFYIFSKMVYISKRITMDYYLDSCYYIILAIPSLSHSKCATDDFIALRW